VEIKGRGALSNKDGRFARREREPDGDALDAALRDGDAPPAPRTELHVDAARTIIARNASPDIGFSQSINPYRGCEHGCIYCYARPSHSYLDLSPGRDFETQIFYKPNAVELLRDELAAPSYVVSPIALGTNTDPYQPVEKQLRITRGILELLLEHRHPLTIVTKGGLILRDLDLLERLAADGLAAVMVSVTTLDDELKRKLEPRTAGPNLRLKMIRELAQHGVPTGVMAAPMIPGARWWSGPMPLNRWVVRVAPAPAAATASSYEHAVWPRATTMPRAAVPAGGGGCREAGLWCPRSGGWSWGRRLSPR